jgi:adenosylcobinamide-phosphate synthase
LLLVCAAVFVRQPTEQAWRILRRDGRKHPSPNSGRPEAAMAGALGVRLGGTNFYDGIPSERPYLGEVVVPLSLRHIYQALHLAVGATVLAIAFGALALSV